MNTQVLPVTTHLVIDCVFQFIGHILTEHHSSNDAIDGSSVSTRDKNTAPINLLREVIYDTIENMDYFTATTTYKRYLHPIFLF